MSHNEPPQNNFPPNINPNIYAFSTYIIGMIIISDLNVTEQNTIGNWLMLLGQFIITNAGQQAMIESRIERNNININSKKHKSGQGPYTSNSNKSNQTTRNEVEFILQEIQKIERELQKLQKDSNQ